MKVSYIAIKLKWRNFEFKRLFIIYMCIWRKERERERERERDFRFPNFYKLLNFYLQHKSLIQRKNIILRTFYEKFLFF